MGQVAALMVVMAVLACASSSAAQVTYHQSHAQPVAGSAPEPHALNHPEFARILEYYRYTAYGTATVMSTRYSGTSIRRVDDGGCDASGVQGGSGSL